MTKDDLHRTPALFRAALTCRIGIDALDGKKRDIKEQERIPFALHCLLSAIEDIAKHLMKEHGK